MSEISIVGIRFFHVLVHNMEYNTSQKKLIMPEYGRHVHHLVQYAVQIQDREQRNAAAYNIIGIMGNLMPQLRESPDFKHKLWNHLLIISNFELDIDAPYSPPSPTEMDEKPSLVPYPQAYIRQKHYGKNLIDMISKAGKLDDCPQRDSLVQLLAMQMKKSYAAWNRSEINNEQIVQDIWDITDGKIQIKPEMIQFTEPPARENTYQSHGGGYMSKRKRRK